MKFIHIENKIDPNDVARVMREAKEDFAKELVICIKNLPQPLYTEDLKRIMGDLLKISPNLL